MQAYLNGRMVQLAKAKLSVEDAGFQHGVALFTTMAVRHGRAFRLDRHLDRLLASAEELGLAMADDRKKLSRAVQRTIDTNDLTDARLRLTVSPGAVSLLRPQEGGKPAKPTVLIVAGEPTRYDPAYFNEGIMAIIAGPGANPFDPLAGHKTNAYWSRLRTLRQAAAVKAGEAIWLQVSNHLAGGSISNIFLVRDGQLLTPIAHGEEVQGALPAPVLPGITRAAVLELADAADLPVQKRMLDVNDLLEADEVFLTNSGWGVLPVTRIEKKTIGTGKVGEITTRLRTDLLALMDRECGDAAS